jgi:aminoglycoside/choline kinase family phosphotransferase
MPSSTQTVQLGPLLDLAKRVTGGTAPLSVMEMPGGASTRRFFRVRLDAARSAVAMFVPEAGKPDEIAKVDERGRRWPFLEVRDLLEASQVLVPKVLGDACNQGFLLVEDLGDDTLARYLETAPDRREHLYQIAIRDLARAQSALETLPTDSIVTQRAFDYDLLRWEIEHFREWAVEARNVTLTNTERSVFDRAADYIAQTIASWPRGFVHRDYQSRNLMVRGARGDERLVWIDFQDALLGPRVYDLVALLNDSYQTFDDAFVGARLDEYATYRGLDADSRRDIGREFDLVTVQRKLKDAGRFVFIEHKKGDPSYLRFVVPTIGKARRALSRLPHDPLLRDLGKLLERVAMVGRSRGTG